jgi:prepilin-type N-terminal cleavage/methylation domain-containing protein
MSIREKGFTLAEMLVAISVLGILTAAAAVGLGILASQFDLDNAARQVSMVLSQARIQAVTRGHRMVVSFGEGEATITDATDDEDIATQTFPSHITVSASSDATFTPVGTTTVPVTVTVSHGDGSRDVRVGLLGEVQIQ